LQIYFDFSGYSDMAIGLALLLGIPLPVNFRSPYKALSVADFWRRWHITLSRFLRDYLYIPLGGNRSQC
jgi:alginate O-acetyltransferase complex protein AlgI